MNIKLVLEFEGTNYSGWQTQQNSNSIQDVIENKLSALIGEEISVIGCGRTDAGVHAKKYTCNFHTNTTIQPDRIYLALNTLLPDDIVALNSKLAGDNFHSRYNAKLKTYSYTLALRKVRSAIERNFCYDVGANVSVQKMIEASKHIIGYHDFTVFRNTGSSVKDSNRTITDIKIVKNENIIKIYITADGFLYNMARIISGTLLSASMGKIKPSDIDEMFETSIRNKTCTTLPAHGLCLEEVFYS